MARKMVEILADYHSGDKLNDDDLEALRVKMTTVADLLSDLGDRFVLTYAYARRMQYNCENFQQARRNKP